MPKYQSDGIGHGHAAVTGKRRIGYVDIRVVFRRAGIRRVRRTYYVARGRGSALTFNRSIGFARSAAFKNTYKIKARVSFRTTAGSSRRSINGWTWPSLRLIFAL